MLLPRFDFYLLLKFYVALEAVLWGVGEFISFFFFLFFPFSWGGAMVALGVLGFIF